MPEAGSRLPLVEWGGFDAATRGRSRHPQETGTGTILSCDRLNRLYTGVGRRNKHVEGRLEARRRNIFIPDKEKTCVRTSSIR